MSLDLPSTIRRFIGDAELITDKIGESPCAVREFQHGGERFFLKSSPTAYANTTYSVRREAQVLDWLSGRLHVPEVVATAERDGEAFMITRAVPGRPLATCIAAGLPVSALFGEALRNLQQVSVSNCPFDASVAMRLRELDILLAKNLIDPDHDLDAWPGLGTPAKLVAHLHAHVPHQDPVFSHGDLCGNNVFVDVRERLFFIDLGRGGIADRWLDIAFVYRELRDRVAEAKAETIMAALGEPDQPDKRRYFEQLDELF
jgi:kanamycin kinase